MLLGDLAGIASDSPVTGFAIDHRKVERGNIFGAFRGSRFNGEDFIAKAVEAGAVAVVARPDAPVVSKTVSRVAPMLGVRPDKRREPNLAEVLPYIHDKTEH